MRQNTVFSTKNTKILGEGTPLPTSHPSAPLHAEILGMPSTSCDQHCHQQQQDSVRRKPQGWNCRGGGVEHPSSCLQALIFEWKSVSNFNPWAKCQIFRHLTPSSCRSIPTLHKRATKHGRHVERQNTINQCSCLLSHSNCTSRVACRSQTNN